MDDGSIALSGADHVALLLADHAAALAALEVERDAAKLAALRLQAQIQLGQVEGALRERRTHAEATAAVRRDLAAALAARYAVNWQTHVLEPTTGQLVEVPKD